MMAGRGLRGRVLRPLGALLMMTTGLIAVSVPFAARVGAIQPPAPTSAAEAPVPAGAATNPGVNLNNSVCSDASDCVAVGTYSDAASESNAVIETLFNGTWTAAMAPLP